MRYQGLFECASVELAKGYDRDQKPRQIIIFDLVPVNSAAIDEDLDSSTSFAPVMKSIDELRQAAYAASTNTPPSAKTGHTKQSWYERARACATTCWLGLRASVKPVTKTYRFSRTAPPSIEPHHTKRLAEKLRDPTTPPGSGQFAQPAIAEFIPVKMERNGMRD